MMSDLVNKYENCRAKMEVMPTVYVEIELERNSSAPRSFIETKVKSLLPETTSGFVFPNFSVIPELRDHVHNVVICCDDEDGINSVKENHYQDTNVRYCVYRLSYDEPEAETLDDNSDFAAATHWLLPNALLQGLWESLIYDSNIKSHLLSFASTTLLFSDSKVDSNIITWNRVVLLHGPPGTGKTSLCKALAQKLSIRFNDRYLYGQLIEINSHSLFSKWFSESGKLVMKMFDKIQESIDDSQALVLVLIDEIESLAHARKSTLSGNEPSDAVRVVNAILTQLDVIKKYPNVLILTTSNVTGAIDLALVDRADIKQYIGFPSPRAIYKILKTCTMELFRAGIIKIEEEKTWTDYDPFLVEISEKSKGLSGRTLRKLPFLAHALFLQKKVSTLPEFLIALSKAVDKQFEEMKDLKNDQ